MLVGELAPAMARRGKGAIVNVGTMVAEFGMAGTSLYGAPSGRPGPAHQGVGGRVRPGRGPGQRRQPGAHPDRGDSGSGRGGRPTRGAGPSRAPPGFTGRDRRGHHLPGFGRRQLRSRRDPRCRRRPHSGLTDTGTVASALTASDGATARPPPASPTTPAGREVTRRRSILSGPIGTLLNQVAQFPAYTGAYLAASPLPGCTTGHGTPGAGPYPDSRRRIR